MDSTRFFSLSFVAFALASVGCAKKPALPEALETTGARLPRPSVHVDRELARLCKITFGNVEKAPKFNFDDATLLPEDRDVLVQVARCVTTGPLAGRGLSLVGRADPRGELEYNLVLGEHRADGVGSYLALLGVEQGKMAKTSRGELDAEGTDEDGWHRDRRVDITLAPRAKATTATGDATSDVVAQAAR